MEMTGHDFATFRSVHRLAILRSARLRPHAAPTAARVGAAASLGDQRALVLVRPQSRRPLLVTRFRPALRMASFIRWRPGSRPGPPSRIIPTTLTAIDSPHEKG